MNRERLEKNIIDQIKEAQIKLGYAQETVRLYYPVSSLNALLETKQPDAEAMLGLLKASFSADTGRLGKLSFCIHGGRIEISVPPEGAEYVHEKIETPEFLAELIELFANHHACSREDICRMFSRFSPDYVCERMPDGADFDYVMYFQDPSIDEYYYCIKEEMGHTIYHRFMKEDYQAIREA